MGKTVPPHWQETQAPWVLCLAPNSPLGCNLAAWTMGGTTIQLRRDSSRNVSPIVRVTRFTQEHYDYGAHDVRLIYKEWGLMVNFSLGSRLYRQYIRKKRRAKSRI
jgi:hypothetical protein